MQPTMYVTTSIPAGEIRVPFYEQTVSDLTHRHLCNGARILSTSSDGSVILETNSGRRFHLQPA